MQIQTILAPVDCSPLAERVARLAIEVAETFGSRLLLLHNLEDAPPGLAATWMHRSVQHEAAERASAEDTEEAARSRVRELLALAPEGLPVEGRLTRGLVVPAVLQLIAEQGVDLVVLGSHDRDPVEHASMAEALLARSPCPVLTPPTIGEGATLHAAAPEGPRRVLAATDFTRGGDHAVDYAIDLARKIDFDLELLHVLPSRATFSIPVDHLGPAPRLDVTRQAALERMQALAPKDFDGRVRCHVVDGDPADAIVAFAAEHGIAVLVAGGHSRSLWRGLLTANTAKRLLHQRPAAVWFVPEPQH